MKSGILLLDKPAGLSSAQALAALKRKLKIGKAGHAGTLDPLATGLLVVLVNKATRLASYAEAGEKVYSGTFRFGLRTSSDDIAGEVLSECHELPPFSRIQDKAQEFLGSILQTPPQVSALKVNGQRAYALASKGQAVPLEPRQVEVSEFSLKALSQEVCAFRLRCSKGTYVRSIARDLGEGLGCGACVASLRREYSAPFSVERAKSLEEIGASDMLCWEELFPAVPRIKIEPKALDFMRRGHQGILEKISREKLLTINKDSGLAIYEAFPQGAAGLLSCQDGRWQYGVNLED